MSYHFRVLADGNGIKLTDTQQVRGSVQHFYALGPSIKEQPWVLEQLDQEPKPPEPVEFTGEPLSRLTFQRFEGQALSRMERRILTLRFGSAPMLGPGFKAPVSRAAVAKKLKLPLHAVREHERFAITKLERARREANRETSSPNE